METLIKDIDTIRKIIEVTVPAETVASSYKKVIEIYGKKLNIPGFRAGKAPVDLIKKQYAEDLQASLENDIIHLVYDDLQKHPTLRLHAILKVEVPSVSATPPRPCLVLVTAEARPTFELPNYKGIAVSLPKTSVTDEKIQATLDYIRGQHATFQPVNRPAKKGDHVKISYEGTLGDKKIADLLPKEPLYGTQNNTWEEAGVEVTLDTAIPAVVEGIVGMKAGDQKTVTMQYPNDFPIPVLAGQSANYAITVHEVNEKVLPEWNADLFKAVGVESLEQLKENIEKQMQAHQKSLTRSQLTQKIGEYLNSHTEFSTPPSAIEGELSFLTEQFAKRLLKAGFSKAQIEANSEQLIKEVKRQAETSAKLGFILEAIAEKEKIAPNELDFKKYFFAESMRTQQSPDALMQELKDNKDALHHLRKSVLHDKVLDFLAEEAHVEYVDA